MMRDVATTVTAGAAMLVALLGLRGCTFELPAADTSGGDASLGGAGGTNAGGTSAGGSNAGGTGAGGTSAGGTSAGGTSAGGTGAGGAGGGDPPCNPPVAPGACTPGLDVAPTIIGVGSANIISRPYLAWAGSVFGVYTWDAGDFQGASSHFFTLSREGKPLTSPTGTFKQSGNDESTMIALNGHFALTAHEASTVVYRFDQCGQALGTITLDKNLNQSLLVAGSADTMLALGPPGMSYAILKDAPGSTTLAPVGLSASCCSDRRFGAAYADGTYWLATQEGADYKVARYNEGSGFSSQWTFNGLGGSPRWVVPFSNNRLVVTTTGSIGLWDTTAAGPLKITQFGNGLSCVFASVGSTLKRACRITPDAGVPYISFGNYDPAAGVSTPQHQLYVTAVSSGPAIAWDGNGWGIAWYEAGNLAYAHVCGT